MNTTSIYRQIVLLLSTGIRRGELMGLQWGDAFDRNDEAAAKAIDAILKKAAD